MAIPRSLLILSLLLVGSAAGAETDPVAPPDYRQVLADSDLSPRDRAHLERDGVLLTERTFKQVFAPYVRKPGAGFSAFITSDALLAGYDVLFEESLRLMEQARAKRLTVFLETASARLAKPPAAAWRDEPVFAAAQRRARLVIDTALALLGGKAATGDAELAAAAAQQAAAVTAATGAAKPAWLGPPDRGFLAIDYSRCKPRGFYASDPALSAYFRANAWLQAIPMRPDRDDELLTAVLIAATIDPDTLPEATALLRGYRQLIGPADDGDLIALRGVDLAFAASEDTAGYLRRVRAALAPLIPAPAINDQLAFPPTGSAAVAEPSLRVLTAARLPDAVLFQTTTDPRRFQRPWPSGLELCAALGSDHARGLLAEPALLAAIAAHPLTGDSLYVRYLDCLAALELPPAATAPPFMAGVAWRIKSDQTVLAGWALQRHAWVLQAKDQAFSVGLSRSPSFLIEPDPEFFKRLGEVSELAIRLLQEQGAFAASLREVADDLRAAADFHDHRRDRPVVATADPPAGSPNDADELVEPEEIDRPNGAFSAVGTKPFDRTQADRDTHFRMLFRCLGPPRQLRRLADELAAGRRPSEATAARFLAELTGDIEPRWRSLAACCHRLAALSRKQLAVDAWSGEEQGFLEGFGIQLANLMGYQGNSWLDPKDDAPRIVDVFANPQLQGHLAVATGRPQALLVLYPWQGTMIPCIGAVLPYREFVNAERLDDGQWRSRLDIDPPPPPRWLEPIMQEDPPPKPAAPPVAAAAPAPPKRPAAPPTPQATEPATIP